MNYSIEIENLSKCYKTGKNKKEIFLEWFTPFYKSNSNMFWALKDIRFCVAKGESVGIVGMNGAGKSTLLKIITGTTIPTTGTVKVEGRTVALLELGMGFHPEFSGRENIRFAGQLIGLSVAEINEKLHEIEEFAEIGRFIDDPVRTYSSGMQMRLAFSLATSVRPDILIVDEALSVGDTYFQQKSFARIRQFREAGTTLLFVSHDKSAILTLCDRAILLDKGNMILDDKPSVVMDYYNSLIAKKSEDGIDVYHSQTKSTTKIVSGTKEVYFTNVFLQNDTGERLEYVKTGEKVTLVADISSQIDYNNVVFGFMIKERTGMEIYGTNTFFSKQSISVHGGESRRLKAIFTADIGPGIYSVSVALHTEDTHLATNFNWIDLAVTFSVINMDKQPFVGVTCLQSLFEIE